MAYAGYRIHFHMAGNISPEFIVKEFFDEGLQIIFFSKYNCANDCYWQMQLWSNLISETILKLKVF